MWYRCYSWWNKIGDSFNTLRPRQNGRHFADDIFKRILLNENVWIPIKISLKNVPKGPINNISALVQIMAWRRPGDKPLSEPMMVSLLTHICDTRPQWVNQLAPGRCRSNSTTIFHKLDLQLHILNTSCESGLWWVQENPTDNKSILVQVMTCHHQATSHYISQCWSKILSPDGVTRPQWVSTLFINFKYDMFNQELLDSNPISIKALYSAILSYDAQWYGNCMYSN